MTAGGPNDEVTSSLILETAVESSPSSAYSSATKPVQLRAFFISDDIDFGQPTASEELKVLT